jgi:hypothetical protein
MPIINDYGAIAKRMRELRTPNPKGAERITDLERWRDAAKEVAQTYVEQRRRELIVKRAFRRPQPTD